MQPRTRLPVAGVARRRRRAALIRRASLTALALAAVALVAQIWLVDLPWYAYPFTVGIPLFAVLLIMMTTHEDGRPLPALDRTPRRAVVTGRTRVRLDDPDMGPDELVTVEFEIDGVTLQSHLVDRIAHESLDRFIVGSVWQVYAFAGPVTQGESTEKNRVLLTEAHEDVLRCGYDLVSTIVTTPAKPGSPLLWRQFENDPEPAAGT